MSVALTLNYRRPELTVRCVRSLLDDGWQRVLVWDNSDDEGTSASRLREVFRDEMRVDVVDSNGNLGFAAGVNRGLAWLDERAIAGPVLVINNDAFTPPGTRDALVGRLAHDPSAALLAPRIEQHGALDGWMYYVPWLGLVLHRPMPGAMGYLSGCCLLINREALPGAVFDERFFMYGEDVELSLRCRRASLGLVLVEDASIHHQGSAGSGLGSRLYEELTIRSRLLLVDAWWRGSFMRGLAFLSVVAAIAARALVRSLRFRSLVPLSCVLAVARNRRRTGGGFNPGNA